MNIFDKIIQTKKAIGALFINCAETSETYRELCPSHRLWDFNYTKVFLDLTFQVWLQAFTPLDFPIILQASNTYIQVFVLKMPRRVSVPCLL